MPRYSLRTLLIALGVAPLLITAAWYLLGFGDQTYRRALKADLVIRDELLEATPRGTNAADVVLYVDRELAHVHAEAYSKWVWAYRDSIGRAPLIIPTTTRKIRVIVGQRSKQFPLTEHVQATWHFDGNDKVTDIIIERHAFGS